MPHCTVLIPTHDHVETLRYSIASVQAQTYADFEIIVVGDGAPPETAALMAELGSADQRLRYLPFPKGERHGELNRHRALDEARGGIVCYQTDDDLWLPHHLQTMVDLLGDHDLVHDMQIGVLPDSRLNLQFFDAKDGQQLSRMRDGTGGFGLGCGGHTMAAYRRLPRGWCPAPIDRASDVSFWLQFLNQDWCRYRSCPWPGKLHFPTPLRRNWTAAERLAELRMWWCRISDPVQREHLVRSVLQPAIDQLVSDGVRAGDVHALMRALESREAHVEPADLLPVLSSGQSLTFCKGGTAHRCPTLGFANPEHWGCWTMGEVAEIACAVEKLHSDDLVLSLTVLPFLPPVRPKCRYEVHVNGVSLLACDDDIPSKKERIVRVPAVLVPNRILRIEIVAREPVSPRSLGLNADGRTLGVGVVEIRRVN